MRNLKIHSLLREPLLHFLVIGAGLFFLFNQIGEPTAGRDNRIVVTQADLDRLNTIWMRRMGRPPTAQEREQQLNSHIREQVLYREALSMGLDKDDAVVRRRMAQKLKFLFEDIATPKDPDDVQLQTYLEKHPEKFMRPARFTFSQIFFSTDKRGEKAMEDANRLLTQLQNSPAKIDVSSAGDALMLNHHYTDTRLPEVTRIFGKHFSEKLNDVTPEQWTGPLDSPFGLHLIYVQQRSEAHLPKLAEVRDQVKREYVYDWQRDANEQFYDNLRKRYEVVVERSRGDSTDKVQIETTSEKVALQ